MVDSYEWEDRKRRFYEFEMGKEDAIAIGAHRRKGTSIIDNPHELTSLHTTTFPGLVNCPAYIWGFRYASGHDTIGDD